mgnify:CR=1 FL=1
MRAARQVFCEVVWQFAGWMIKFCASFVTFLYTPLSHINNFGIIMIIENK